MSDKRTGLLQDICFIYNAKENLFYNRVLYVGFGYLIPSGGSKRTGIVYDLGEDNV